MSKQQLQGEKVSMQKQTAYMTAEKKKGTAKDGRTESIREKEKKNEDYWDRIAEDPASGYKNEENDDPLLNVDQQPDDNKKGSEAM